MCFQVISADIRIDEVDNSATVATKCHANLLFPFDYLQTRKATIKQVGEKYTH